MWHDWGARKGHRQDRPCHPVRELEVEKTSSANNETQSKERDGDFANEAHRERPKTLLAHFTEIRAQSDTGERQQKRPAGEIGE